ncbi:hypothetical protein Tco_1151129 [Tanacetum coccineum]
MLLFRILLWRILPLVPLVLRFFLRLELLRSERPLLLAPLQAMLLSLLGDSDDENDGDDDACVEIPLVTPLRSVAMIPPSGNQGRSSVAPPTEGSNTRDSRGKGIMVDDVVAPSSGVSQPRSSFGPAPSFRDVSSDAIHTDFVPFFPDPYYATYLEDGVAGNYDFTREE